MVGEARHCQRRSAQTVVACVLVWDAGSAVVGGPAEGDGGMPPGQMSAEEMLDDAWLRSGGADGPLGAPVGAVADIGGGNLRRGFERGEIAWSAGQEMVVTAYRLHDYVCFDWSLAPGSQLHYEFWQFEVFRDGAGQGFSNATLSGLP